MLFVALYETHTPRLGATSAILVDVFHTTKDTMSLDNGGGVDGSAKARGSSADLVQVLQRLSSDLHVTHGVERVRELINHDCKYSGGLCRSYQLRGTRQWWCMRRHRQPNHNPQSLDVKLSALVSAPTKIEIVKFLPRK